MTSKKTKRKRLDEARLKRARASKGVDPFDAASDPPHGAVMADRNELLHNNTYGPLPRFYVDKIVVCRNCGKEEVWPAARQKWWYEVAKGNINTDAVYCRNCRDKEKARKAEARKAHFEGLGKKKLKSE
jgi:hypothetical protein